MALTAAERMKNYRERLKNNPQKYEELRKKHIDRMKLKKKKISEMTEEEKVEQRKLWQKYKKKQRQNENKQKRDDRKTDNNTKKTDTKTKQVNDRKEETKENSVSYYKLKAKKLQRNCSKLKTKCTRLEERLIQLSRSNDKINKRYYRSQKLLTNKVSTLQLTINKMKAREEMLEKSLRDTYQNCVKRTEKRIMKSVVTNAKKNKTYVAKLLGLSARARTRTIKRKINNIAEIENFYQRDDVSRCTSGKRECRTKNKNKQQIRYLLDTQQNLYKKYRDEGGKFKFSTFCKYRPFYVISPNLGSRDTCLCVKHSNIELAFTALKKNRVLHQKDIKEVLASVSCDITSHLCMYGNCLNCKSFAIQYNTDKENEEIAWQEWERVDHIYTKQNQETTTKKTVKNTKNGTVKDLISEFKTKLEQFKKHYYNLNHQQKQYQTVLRTLKENEVLIICDFSENYETKMSSEIQSMHFGASKGQVSLHTGMIYWHNKCQSFTTVSPNTSHKPAAIWAHLTPLLKIVKEETPAVDVVHFYSDGPTSQYRQKHNFFLHSVFTKDLDLKYSTWSFFEAGHGKGVADGIGGTIKRVLDRQVCFGRDITNAQDAFEILKDSMKVIKIFYIPDIEIDRITAMLPSNVLPLKGTFEVHQTVVVAAEKYIVKHRKIGCFCGDSRGLCSCYAPKTHFLLKPESDKENAFEMYNEAALIPEMFPLDLASEVTDRDIEMVGDTIDLILRNNSEPQDQIVLNTAEALEDYSPPSKKPKIEFEINYLNNMSMPTMTDQSPITKPHPIANSLPHSLPSTSDQFKFNVIVQEHDPLSTLNSMKIPKQAKQKKSLKTVVKRKFKCEKCNGLLVHNKISKCMGCQNWFCYECSGGQIYIDYICDLCLGADSESE